MRPSKNKSQQVADSINAKIKLLELIHQRPRDFSSNEEIIKCLKNQVTFASLELEFTEDDKTWRSTSISLTTLKTKIYNVTENLSFESFDRMRTGAYEKLEESERRSETQSKVTKTGLAEKLKQSDALLEKQREYNFHLLQALIFCKSTIETIGQLPNEKAREKQSRDAVKTIASILSLNDYPFNRLERLTESMQHTLRAVDK
ncbi:hypothetical protein [Pseudomonas monteilii]|uniref:hypothetical protein n=1 Tax=Pseudomonas monteilii TaxID=76759 RepID=UPI00076172A0|nr:hypothetical protein [Pseudomonas monteilii]